MSYETVLPYQPPRYKHCLYLHVVHFGPMGLCLVKVTDENGFDITAAISQDEWDEMTSYMDDQYLDGYAESDRVET